MKTITNEQKAKNMTKGFLKEGLIKKNRLQELLIKAMGWKDKQHAQEKQQWIDNAADFISQKFYIGINNQVTSKENYYTLTELIRDFEQTMKEQ